MKGENENAFGIFMHRACCEIHQPCFHIRGQMKITEAIFIKKLPGEEREYPVYQDIACPGTTPLVVCHSQPDEIHPSILVDVNRVLV